MDELLSTAGTVHLNFSVKMTCFRQALPGHFPQGLPSQPINLKGLASVRQSVFNTVL
uniref:Uncharacterized protein n=1 Tax=Anguilla anguilla TaxID=7936 RepID=A0A0E9RS01_ANGAN